MDMTRFSHRCPLRPYSSKNTETPMKQFVNILLLAIVGAGALNAYQFKFDNKSAVVVSYGNGQQLTMKIPVAAAGFLSERWNVRGKVIWCGSFGGAVIMFESGFLSMSV